MLSGYVNELDGSEFSGKVGKYTAHWRSKSTHSHPSITYILEYLAVECMGCLFIYYVNGALCLSLARTYRLSRRNIGLVAFHRRTLIHT